MEKLPFEIKFEDDDGNVYIARTSEEFNELMGRDGLYIVFD